jgi:hypothetical protein
LVRRCRKLASDSLSRYARGDSQTDQNRQEKEGATFGGRGHAPILRREHPRRGIATTPKESFERGARAVCMTPFPASEVASLQKPPRHVPDDLQ